jgi:hypothetical protein
MLSGMNNLRITSASSNTNVHQNLLGYPFNTTNTNTNQALIDTLQHQYKLQQQQQQLLIANLPSPPVLANLNRLTSSAYDPLGSTTSANFELEHLRTLERQKIRELEREKDKLRKLEREKEGVREMVAQAQMANVLEGLYGTGIGIRGFVEEDSEGCD